MYFIETYKLTQEAQNNYAEFLAWYKKDRAEWTTSAKVVWAASNLIGEPGWDIEEWYEIENYAALDRMREEGAELAKKPGWEERVGLHAKYLISVSHRIARGIPIGE
jgi:hypothetical protein